MSYETTLVIDYHHLKACLPRLNEEVSSPEYTVREVADTLIRAIRLGPKTIKGVDIVLINPEGTTFNKAVRQRLDALGVEYVEDY